MVDSKVWKNAAHSTSRVKIAISCVDVEWTAIMLKFKTETPFKQDQLVFH